MGTTCFVGSTLNLGSNRKCSPESSILKPLICVSWAKNWVKNSPEIAPRVFCIFCTWRMSRVLVSHAYASMVFFACHAYASGTHTRRCTILQITRTRRYSLIISFNSCAHSICASFFSIKSSQMLPKINKITRDSK
ncbi:uncharacterized protein DS421_5g144010 [Arachis hypogaea]|nr:uncharacterized protein DS421_5g144010 [Arachis hypogaea]